MPVVRQNLDEMSGNMQFRNKLRKCNSEIVALLDEEGVMVLENRRGADRAGQVKVSVAKTKDCKQVQPIRRAVSY